MAVLRDGDRRSRGRRTLPIARHWTPLSAGVERGAQRRAAVALRYIRTRGEPPAVGFEEVLRAGPAPDGGLYLPER